MLSVMGSSILAVLLRPYVSLIQYMDAVSSGTGAPDGPRNLSLTLNSSARGLSLYPGPTLRPLEDKPQLSSPPTLLPDMTSEKIREETRKVLILHSPWPHVHV